MILNRLSSKAWGVAGFCVLAVLIVAAYWPSLWHVARGDQINYLAELSLRHGFRETVLGTLDINRTRTFAPGDELAFRPLLFFILGLQKYLFGYGFMWWQAVALMVHLFVCGALYALLCRVRGRMFAFLGVGMFAFAPVNIEPVVWHHITPYLLFGGCVLMALRNLYASEHDDVKTSFHTAMAVGWMLPAVFLYETGIWYALCMGAFLWLRGRRVAAHAMGVIIVLYFVADVADFVWRHAVALQAGELAHKGFFLLTLTNMGLLGKWFLSAFFFLGSKDLLSLSRMMVRPEIVGWAWPWGFPLTISIAVGAVALAVSTLVLGQSLVRRGFGRNGPMLALCFFMALGYLAVIAVGRINLQGAFAVRVGLYYPYNFLILLLVAVALVSSGYGSWHYNLPDKLIRCFGACIIAATVVFYAATVHRVTAQMAYDHRQNRIFLAALDRYVKAHEKEPGFSFYIGPEYPGNYTADWVTRRGDPQGRLYTIAEALYFPQFTRNNPKHVIKLEH